jgi:CRISPR-associated protein Cmr2
MTIHLHFTFGPVQGFVAQARRTRDLYSGSFLLSWLAYKAMGSVCASGGRIILPDFAVVKSLIEQKQVKHGVAPNRFVAKFDDEHQAAEAAKQACAALQEEWRRNIAEKIWERFVKKAAPCGNGGRAIWDRQIDHFWEIAWAVGDEKETNLLDCRKNWRTPPMLTEGGDHCSLMGQFQESSGFIRSRELGQQNVFWEAVRNNSGSTLNLEKDERLCAIALVKRFFPEVAQTIIGYDLEAKQWPSTVSIAAWPWLKTIKKKEDEKLLNTARAYAALVKKMEPAAIVSAPNIPLFDDYPDLTGDFKNLSGNFFNRTALQNTKGTELRPETDRSVIVSKLHELEQASGDRAGNFYTLLLMDGDNMGKLIREQGAEPVTAALTDFSAQAPDIVHKQNGITVYAGGDDLFALLPLDTALDCAVKVSVAYKQAFQRYGIKASISGAVVFAHYSVPLRQVIHQAYFFLDTVAKDQTERDALAIAVLKPGGETCRWAGKFKRFSPPGCEGKNCFQPLVAAFKEDTLSSKYLYNLRQRFAALEEDLGKFKSDDIIQLFTAELVHGRLDKDPPKAKVQREAATALIRKLVYVCFDKQTKKLDFDGARLVRFLALDGKEGNDR